MSVELSKDELCIIRWALQEAGTRRLEQVIECRRESSGACARSEAEALEADANNHFKLSMKFFKCINKAERRTDDPATRKTQLP